MKDKSLGRTLVTLSGLLFSLITATACGSSNNKTPEDVVRQYWKYCSKKQIDKAADLTCLNLSCIDPQVPNRNSRATVRVRSQAINTKGEIIHLDENSDEHILFYPYNGEVIIDGQYELTQIIETKTSDHSAQVTIAAENKFGMKFDFVNCLRKERNSENWKIDSMWIANAVDFSKDDPCLIREGNKD